MANPLSIIRRLIALPFWFSAKCALCLIALLGWGIDAAQETWEKNW